MTSQIDAIVGALHTAPVVLIACDYDGTLAPIVNDPNKAQPARESIVALRALAALPDTHVAVISGRSLRDLASLSRLPDEIHLVGSHGSEFEPGFASEIDAQLRTLLDQVTAEINTIAATAPGSSVERKPASVAFHYRAVDPATSDDVQQAVLDGPAARAGIRVKRGKMVIELAVIDTDKGSALDHLRSLVHADVVMFIGDDFTDEDGFRVLRGPDVGVKVGEGDTLAEHRIADPSEVSRLLATVFERRRAWLEGDSAPPIERHSLLSDQRTLALLTPDARVSWLCHPRADSPAVFAALLGGPGAGTFAVQPEPYRVPLAQRYVGDSMVVETRWVGLKVIDYLDASFGRVDQPPGRTDLVRVLDGDCAVLIEFAPRFDFGRASTVIEPIDGGLEVVGSPEVVRLMAPGVTWEIIDEGEHQRARAIVLLQAGSPLVLQMRLGAAGDSEDRPEVDRRRSTMDYWTQWSAGLTAPMLAPAMMRRSALLLKALCHQPTGAILAAATTSLPEVVGGVRNWDYRFCWPRDAAVAATALVAMGSTAEALAFLEWLAGRLDHVAKPEQLRPLYPLSGDEFIPEAVIPTLNGYLGSRPVRIGNMAEHQVQLDMFGPIVELIWQLAKGGTVIDDRLWRVTCDLVDAVTRRWHEPDHGIWEERRARRHHVHSKVMCWSALDRGVSLAQACGRATPTDWTDTRAAIHADVVANGWNPTINSFSAAYGDDDLDAALLQLALVGFLPHDDPRIVATVAAVEGELRTKEIVYRYHHDDGLPGREGGFLLCSAWLIEALVNVGRIDDARPLFERYLALAGPTGMLAEQFDPVAERALGNVPQAYSHAGLIQSGIALARAAEGT